MGTGYLLLAVIDRGGAERLMAESPCEILQRVEIIPVGDIAAVIYPEPPSPFRRGSQRRVARIATFQSHLLERLMEDALVVASGFDFKMHCLRSVRQFLITHQSQLRRHLLQYGSTVEVSVDVTWDLNGLVRRVLTEEGLTPSQTEQRSSLPRVRPAIALEHVIARRRARLTNKIDEAIRPLIVDRSAEDGGKANTLCKFKVMIQRHNEIDLYHRLRSLAEQSQDGICVRSIGPVPPSSFVRIEAQDQTPHRLQARQVILIAPGTADLAA